MLPPGYWLLLLLLLPHLAQLLLLLEMSLSSYGRVILVQPEQSPCTQQRKRTLMLQLTEDSVPCPALLEFQPPPHPLRCECCQMREQQQQ
jgi:hypothetical protein